MLKNLNNNYQLISPNQVNDFINSNERTIEIINAMEPPLNSFFPETELSLKVCDKLNWTSETKLLLNVRVGEDVF